MAVSSIVLLLAIALPLSTAFTVSNQPVSKLLTEHASSIAQLKAETAKLVSSVDVEPYANDVFFLRYCLKDYDSDAARLEALKQNLKWRVGSGSAICDAALSAVSAATANGKWDNDPVRKAAPSGAKINQYLTPSQALTTSTSQGDLVYCIRAGKIDDVALMKSLSSPKDMVDFFVYCKEVNANVANTRSLQSDKLVHVLTANDLSGVKLIGGDASFRSALSEASKLANDLYPSLAGPSLLLNLPPVLGALAKLFTPLFPAEVRKRLKFEQGPLKDVEDLLDVSYGGSSRQNFLKDLDKLVYQSTD